MITSHVGLMKTATFRTADSTDIGLSKAAYSVTEACHILSLGRNKIYDLVKSGELPIVKVGKRTLFVAADLAALLNKHRAAAVSGRGED